MNPLISIIIPNYNGEKFIAQTLNSVLNQTYTHFELIIVDDGSTDNSPFIIQEFVDKEDRIKFYKRSSENKGASVCRNIGIKNSTGNFIIFLDSDDLLAPFCLQQRLDKMEEYARLDFAVFNMEIFRNSPGDDGTIINKYIPANNYLTMFLEYNLPWQTTCPIWRTSFLKYNGIRFDERYQRLQDPEFHTKILLNHKPNFFIFKETPSDCFYRLANHQMNYKKESLDNLINGLMLYVSDLRKLNSTQHLHQFFKNTIHATLFYYKLKSFRPIKAYVRCFSKEERKISVFTIYLFFLFNTFGLTFKKGFGITRLWNLFII